MLKYYNSEIKTFNLGKYGPVEYAQWLHPLEGQKTFTENQLDLIRKYVPRGSIVIDIGAHTGDTTVPYSVLTGQDGAVIAFEPNPTVYRVLLENARLNSFRNITAVNMAVTSLSDGYGLYTFHYSDEDLCNGGYMDALETGVGTGGHWWPIQVRGVGLLYWLKKHCPQNISKISFIKIDAEGYDAQIIRNITPLLQVVKPALQTEIYSHLTTDERTLLYSAITEAGYSIYDFSNNGKDIDRLTEKLSRKDIETMDLRSGHDLMCFYGGIEQWKIAQKPI